jgi:hypothetical protein
LTVSLTVYVASKAGPAEIALWTALRGAGVPIISSWIDAEINRTDRAPTPDAWSHHWERCLEESSSADLTIFYAPEGATQCGALIEIGSALANGRAVWIVSDYEWSISHHPRCRVFKSIEECVAAIMARVAGAEARVLAQLAGTHGRAA